MQQNRGEVRIRCKIYIFKDGRRVDGRRVRLRMRVVQAIVGMILRVKGCEMCWIRGGLLAS